MRWLNMFAKPGGSDMSASKIPKVVLQLLRATEQTS